MKPAKYLVICAAIFSFLFQIPGESNEGMNFHSLLHENYSIMLAENRPLIPYYTKIYILPAGSKFSVDVEAREIKNLGEAELKACYIPAPPGYEIKEGSYDKYIIYPEKWYSWNAMGGIKDGKHVVVLKINLYPVRYVNGNVLYANNFSINVDYELSPSPLFNVDTYDLLIITPDKWISVLQPLKEHKEKHGIKTIVVGLDEIYGGKYFAAQGRDDAEKIKYFIKDAIENWGIKYVLLVGGRKPGIQEKWLMPVRYVHVTWPESGYVENRYISDLYFADIYDANYSFSSWDTDGNGVFCEWRKMDRLRDDIDLYPDVYLGRWACRNEWELKTIIDKTIEYEMGEANKKIVLVGGDTFEPEGIEGEIVCDKTMEYLPGYEAARVYASRTDVNPRNIRNALGDGSAFMLLHGHGGPIRWNTCKPGVFDRRERGLWIFDLPFFFNREYPITIFGGCHTAMFNISMTVFSWSIPSPEGLSWWFARKYNGGGIASFGYTAFPVGTPGEAGDLDGDGINEPDCVESGYGYMELGIFDGYAEGKQYLGECWSHAVSRYIEHFKIPYERWHFHTIQSFVLLGDPSLKINGYAS